MDEPWRIVIHQSRYGGVYERRSKWFAVFCGDEFPEETISDDVPCAVFWGSKKADTCGVGNTPNEALESLFANNGHAASNYERLYGIKSPLKGRQRSWASRLKQFVVRFSIRAFR